MDAHQVCVWRTITTTETLCGKYDTSLELFSVSGKKSPLSSALKGWKVSDGRGDFVTLQDIVRYLATHILHSAHHNSTSISSCYIDYRHSLEAAEPAPPTNAFFATCDCSNTRLVLVVKFLTELELMTKLCNQTIDMAMFCQTE